MEIQFECEKCGEFFMGILHANNEVLSTLDSVTIGCAASEEYDETTPTLCTKCGAEKYIV